MRISRFLIVFLLLLLHSKLSYALQATAVDSSKVLQDKIQSYDAKLETLSQEIKKRSQLIQKMQQGSSSPSYFWEESSLIPDKRQSMLRLLKAQLKIRIDEYEHCLSQKENLESEYEWLEQSTGLQEKIKITTQLGISKKTVAKKSIASQHCEFSPVELENSIRPQILKNFGSEKDLESGLTWQTTGWWIGRGTTESVGVVRNCNAGSIAFAGQVKGRGFAVLVDHGGGFMTLYANLKTNTDLREGMALAAGSILSPMPDKLYFEVRKAGLVTDPANVLSAELLTRWDQGTKSF